MIRTTENTNLWDIMVFMQGRSEILGSNRTVTPADSSTTMHTMRIAVAQLTEIKTHMMLADLT